ncbi:transglutaminase-like cysteine peptidase [Devosia sp. XJ19-1]|uniref:Transglutaminase-like cysteine peptidase n=1 Tax=Devosia ureilytica TaxID=2952754 RepID=A0A9Q4FTC4_9HYPH|nr:transglutaminase-like cysteine peptidase [Devosia ureilytica]MCP8884117.1 transglutaminase-like cysteine peptidase [Devosia ureilytica]MCP8887725.1 transglutaminase-like cysteine peptidase [Devosia ureilytica]
MSLKSITAIALALVVLTTSGPSFAATQTPAAGQLAVTIAGSERSVSLPTPRPSTTLLPTFTSRPPASLGVFKSVAISAARLPAAGKWQTARSRDYTGLFSENCASEGLRGCDTNFARQLRSVASQANNLSERDLLDLVNRKVNSAMRYREDLNVWGTGDYWATPNEMALKGAGDCEDFAIAKYWLLRSLGVADSQLQMVVLQDTRRRLFHAVLVVHTASGAYVLDNVTNRLQRDTAYAQYLPIMSFAAGKNYIHGFSGGTRSTTAMPSDLSAVSPGLGI